MVLDSEVTGIFLWCQLDNLKISEKHKLWHTKSSAGNYPLVNMLCLSIHLLTHDNYTLWKNRVENMLDLQELRNSLTTETETLSASEDVQLRTILTSKLESTIHANVITHENEKSSKMIWKSISDYFASSQAANHARTSISQLHEVGIILPKDIIAYLILNKLPPSMSNVQHQSADHSLRERNHFRTAPQNLFPHLSSLKNLASARSGGTIQMLRILKQLVGFCILIFDLWTTPAK
ncbi:uncharacterized protein VP01_4276g1 [Puccinia sorghi]|uniref:Uncharacterized protein n=1 Tax=Puccinia sorghi TaxID=27349 RepID=A0A0L6UR44_9BASI|nr:uncharacterized protein VP01_4276g1 [Puccinia sorghi]